ncbi:hypothetical protein ACA910_000491 [Epithemia clementina (nom. ined.)]
MADQSQFQPQQQQQQQQQRQQQAAAADQQILTVRAFEEAVALLFANNFDADSGVCLVTLIKILDNVLQKPGDPKVRQLKLSNATVWQKVGQRKGGIEILEACGFQRETLPPPLLSSTTTTSTMALADKNNDQGILMLHPDREQQSVLITARRLLQTRAVEDLKMDPKLLPPYRDPPVVLNNSSTNSPNNNNSGNNGGFNVYAGHRYDAKSAAVGTKLGPSAGYKSKTEIALTSLQQQQKKLEKRLHEQNPIERRWQAFEPVATVNNTNNSNSAATAAAVGDGKAKTGGGGDSTLLMARLQQQQEERKQREEGGFTTAAMRELERLKKEKVYSHVTLTIQFPTGHYVRGQFLPKETIQTVVESLQNDCLTDAVFPNKTTAGNYCLELYVTPPRRLLGINQTLQQEGLVPAAKVFVSWKKGHGPKSSSSGQNEPFLYPHLFASTEAAPSVLYPTAQAVAAAAAEQQERDAAAAEASNTTNKKKKKKGDREDEMLKRMMGGGGGGW